VTAARLGPETEHMSPFAPVTARQFANFMRRGLPMAARMVGSVRTDYDAHYYAAFLRDPDGNKIEVVTFARD
jgi:catechol 2,3-dioxygenase-like lactoylglutathione lyase family enzyme